MITKPLVLAFLLFAVNASADVLFLGANRQDAADVIAKPISAGLLTWSDNDHNTMGVFGSVCCMAYDDRLRLEMGVAFSLDDSLEVHMLTGITAPISDHLIAGIWYGSSWDLTPTADDPYGLMLGYRF